MYVTVLFFAGQRDITGSTSLVVQLAPPACVGDLWQELVRRHPRLAPFGASMLFAVDHEFATRETPLHDGAEVALIPPVSGGAPPPPLMRVTDAPLDPAALVAAVAAPDMGAVVTFAGVARDNFAGRATASLEYQAYLPMAEQVLASIASDARERFGTGAIAIHHRVGHLAVGETAVLVVVAAAHRRAAFAAAEWIMDRVKQIAPIWKREHWADGTAEWIGNEQTRPRGDAQV